MLIAIVNGSVVVLAIGFLIFVHELGHFLVAKKVGIRVEAFSLGFGPQIFGFQRGETLYKICAIPLGGYVKMAGEMPGDEVVGDGREFSAKTISQRAWVVSAGVIMNVIFAFIAFPLAFSIGVPFATPTIGFVAEGGPAWEADIRPGDTVKSIDESEVISFTDIRLDVAFSTDVVDFVLERDGREITRKVRPAYNKERGFSEVRVGADSDLPRFTSNSRAFEYGAEVKDEVLSINGFSPEGAENLQAIKNLRGDLDILVRRLVDGKRVEKTITVPTELVDNDGNKWRVAIRFARTRVSRFVTTGEIGPPERTIPELIGIEANDIIIGIGETKVHDSKGIREAVEALEAGQTLQVFVRRGAAEPDGASAPGISREIALEPHVMADGDAFAFIRALQLVRNGLFVSVDPQGPAARAGMLDGDCIVAAHGEELTQDFAGNIRFQEIVRESKGEKFELTVDRQGERIQLVVEPEAWQVNTIVGEIFSRATQVDCHESFPDSVFAGFDQAVKQFKKIVMTLRSLILGKVAAKNMGGIITIAVVSYTFAEQGLGKILFFMGILSLNLAILNILPIPVLDGGHLVFLVLEKIKGGPISDQAMGYANITGLVLILGLMVFVTFNDIVRFFF